jgi:hypothetical protein
MIRDRITTSLPCDCSNHQDRDPEQKQTDAAATQDNVDGGHWFLGPSLMPQLRARRDQLSRAIALLPSAQGHSRIGEDSEQDLRHRRRFRTGRVPICRRMPRRTAFTLFRIGRRLVACSLM